MSVTTYSICEKYSRGFHEIFNGLQASCNTPLPDEQWKRTSDQIEQIVDFYTLQSILETKEQARQVFKFGVEMNFLNDNFEGVESRSKQRFIDYFAKKGIMVDPPRRSMTQPIVKIFCCFSRKSDPR